MINNTNEKFDYIDITNILLFIYQYGCNNEKESFLEKLKHLKKKYDNNLNIGGTFVLDYLFGVHVEDLDNMNLNIDEFIRNIYSITIKYLNNTFDLESIRTDKLIGGFGEKSDTVIYTKKMN